MANRSTGSSAAGQTGASEAAGRHRDVAWLIVTYEGGLGSVAPASEHLAAATAKRLHLTKPRLALVACEFLAAARRKSKPRPNRSERLARPAGRVNANPYALT